MRTVTVGELLTPGVTCLPQIPEYNYRGGYHILVVSYERLVKAEIEAFRTGAAYFSLSVFGDVLVFQFRFGAVLPWSDCTFTWHKVTAEEQQLPSVTYVGEERTLITAILAEATTGIVKVMRVLSFTPDFTRALHQAIADQAARPFPSNYDALAVKVLRDYSSRDIRNRSIASCKGGDNYNRQAPF